MTTAGTMDIDYKTVTETTGCNVTREQIQRMYTRYRFASEYCRGKDVLEVACGTGQGLGYLAQHAKTVVGGDYDKTIVQAAAQHYRGRVEVRQLDAHALPFSDNSFDVVILHEAIYYLSRPEAFVLEANRVLRSRGTLLVSTANRSWSGFNPSPFSHRYFSAPELYDLFVRAGFDTKLFADCPATDSSAAGKAVHLLKRTAVALHLIPKTMKGKEILKRAFFGKLIPLPPEIREGMASYTPPVCISYDVPETQHKVLFAVGILT